MFDLEIRFPADSGDKGCLDMVLARLNVFNIGRRCFSPLWRQSNVWNFIKRTWHIPLILFAQRVVVIVATFFVFPTHHPFCYVTLYPSILSIFWLKIFYRLRHRCTTGQARLVGLCYLLSISFISFYYIPGWPSQQQLRSPLFLARSFQSALDPTWEEVSSDTSSSGVANSQPLMVTVKARNKTEIYVLQTAPVYRSMSMFI